MEMQGDDVRSASAAYPIARELLHETVFLSADLRLPESGLTRMWEVIELQESSTLVAASGDSIRQFSVYGLKWHFPTLDRQPQRHAKRGLACASIRLRLRLRLRVKRVTP